MKKENQTDVEKMSTEEKRDKNFRSLFPKKKEKKKKIPTADVQRFNATAGEGLSKAQVNERIEQGLVNKTGKKYSKSYRSIFFGNICTGFNLLCAIAA
ncbi:MAG: hypothetical protein IKZ28_05785, partial [Clostridia bacterium]|nr:hypothetical protein [Clostridia bacterium]